MRHYYFPLLVLTILAVNVGASLVATPVSAQTAAGPVDHLTNVGEGMGLNPDPAKSSDALANTMGTIIKTSISVAGAIMMAYIVYAGWLWMTASGEEDKISKAKTILRGSITGLLIIFTAYIITSTVIDRFSRAAGYDTQAQQAVTGS